LLIERHLAGMPLAHVAEQMGISRQTASKWWHRYLEDPDGPWYEDRSTQGTCPHRISAETEARIVWLRRVRKVGPVTIAATVGVSSATVWRVLKAHGLNRLGFIDPPTGTVIRYERDYPGDLVHFDTKKYGRIPPGGGRRSVGEAGYRTSRRQKARIGYVHLHAAIDDHSRLGYAAVYPDATAASCTAFLEDTIAFFATWGITIHQLMTDNAKAYTGNEFTRLRTDFGIDHLLIRPYRPQTNGKVERLHRTLKREWAHARPYTSEPERVAALDSYLDHYNTVRYHTAIKGTPASRVNN
jgi:transposase InsO family protein